MWLSYCWHQKRSSLLADEMGLGKTIQVRRFLYCDYPFLMQIQTISLLQYLRDTQNIPGPFLIIAPLSTTENWLREITDWTGMRV